jgi:hypothetical protein
MEKVLNEEYHSLLEELSARKFYGEVILYFQSGNIESSRVAERNTKSEVRDKMLSRQRQEFRARSVGSANG